MHRLWMIRCDHEYQHIVSNLEWKKILGSGEQEESMLVAYRSIVGNNGKMLCAHGCLVLVFVSLQMVIRVASSAAHEVVAICVMVGLEFALLLWLVRRIRAIDDMLHLKPEANRMLLLSFAAAVVFVLGLVPRGERAGAVHLARIRCDGAGDHLGGAAVSR